MEKTSCHRQLSKNVVVLKNNWLRNLHVLTASQQGFWLLKRCAVVPSNVDLFFFPSRLFAAIGSQWAVLLGSFQALGLFLYWPVSRCRSVLPAFGDEGSPFVVCTSKKSKAAINTAHLQQMMSHHRKWRQVMYLLRVYTRFYSLVLDRVRLVAMGHPFVFSVPFLHVCQKWRCPSVLFPLRWTWPLALLREGSSFSLQCYQPKNWLLKSEALAWGGLSSPGTLRCFQVWIYCAGFWCSPVSVVEHTAC